MKKTKLNAECAFILVSTVLFAFATVFLGCDNNPEEKTVEKIVETLPPYVSGSSFIQGREVSSVTSTFKADTDASEAFTTWKNGTWATAKTDSGKIALTPGKTESELNFAWESENKGTPAIRYCKGEFNEASAAVVKGSAEEISSQNWHGKTYTAANKVVLTGLSSSTVYSYQYTSDKNAEPVVWSDTYNFSTRNPNDFTVILTGDPQIGASGSSDDASADDSSAARDAYNWDITMRNAISKVPDAAFLLSAGDQIDKNGTAENNAKTREGEYAGYLYSEVFRSLPVATTIGNHDYDGKEYSYHFNNPNANENFGKTVAGSGYYFSYGKVLVISINSNTHNVGQHKALLDAAIESNPNATWRIVTFHADIYGSGAPHADSDAMNKRIIFAPLMDEYKIDVCLNGHDHTYSRSYQILNGTVIDYDLRKGSVTNPDGTLYITTGSGSGSKYYDLLSYVPYYIAERTNVCLPAYSTIRFTENSMTIETYDYNGNQYAKSFTIYKNSSLNEVEKIVEKANALDSSRYTQESYNAVIAAKNALLSIYEIEEDMAASSSSAEDNATEAGLLSWYGNVSDNNNKDGAANRLKKGLSTLLDKTYYVARGHDFEKRNALVVTGNDFEKAKNNLENAIKALKQK